PDEAEAFIASAASELGDEHVHVEGPVTGSGHFAAFGDAIAVPYVYWFFGGYSPAEFGGAGRPSGNPPPSLAPGDGRTPLSTRLPSPRPRPPMPRRPAVRALVPSTECR